MFLKLYNNCITNHHNYHSVFERGKIHFERGKIEECLIDMDNLLNSGFSNDQLKNIKPADLLVTRGQAFLEMGEYEKAIEALSEAIKKDPKNKEIVKDVNSISKLRGVEAVWDEIENTAKITFYYDGAITEDELEDYSVANTEIIAHCANAMLEEKFIRLDSPNELPKSEFWAYKREES